MKRNRFLYNEPGQSEQSLFISFVITLILAAILAFVLLDWWRIPSVQKSVQDRRCIKVLSPRYTCRDVGVRLTRYNTILVDVESRHANSGK